MISAAFVPEHEPLTCFHKLIWLRPVVLRVIHDYCTSTALLIRVLTADIIDDPLQIPRLRKYSLFIVRTACVISLACTVIILRGGYLHAHCMGSTLSV